MIAQRLVIFLAILGISTLSSAQSSKDSSLIQFSGVVMTADSLMGIPYVNVVNLRSGVGTYSDYNGYFAFVARMGDTIDFSCIGYKPSKYIIPDTIKSRKYSLIKLMTADTLFLDVSVINPLPKREMFDYYFVKADIPDDDLERARKNLEREALKEQAESMGVDGAEAGKAYLAQHARSYYSAGQIAPNNLLNPIAWAQFFQAWKRGDFKRKDKAITGED